MTDYTIADLYATQSYLQAKINHPAINSLTLKDFRKLHGDLDNITTELRKRVQKMIKDYEPIS